MTRKSSLLVFIALALGALYLYYFTDFFRRQTIQIIPQTRPVSRPGAQAYPVTFSLDGKYRLTEIKVVPLHAYKTNNLAMPSWHLISSSNSAPTHGFLYGMRIKGMKPSDLVKEAAPLQPNQEYRIMIAAGKARGEVDFKAASPPAE